MSSLSILLYSSNRPGVPLCLLWLSAPRHPTLPSNGTACRSTPRQWVLPISPCSLPTSSTAPNSSTALLRFHALRPVWEAWSTSPLLPPILPTAPTSNTCKAWARSPLSTNLPGSPTPTDAGVSPLVPYSLLPTTTSLSSTRTARSSSTTTHTQSSTPTTPKKKTATATTPTSTSSSKSTTPLRIATTSASNYGTQAPTVTSRSTPSTTSTPENTSNFSATISYARSHLGSTLLEACLSAPKPDTSTIGTLSTTPLNVAQEP